MTWGRQVEEPFPCLPWDVIAADRDRALPMGMLCSEYLTASLSYYCYPPPHFRQMGKLRKRV